MPVWLTRLLSWLLSRLIGGQEPTMAEIAEEKGALEERVQAQEKVIEIHEAAGAARADADARVLNDGYDIDADPDGHWRD